MENEFENFLRKKKDKIESGTPPPRVWENLKDNLILHHKQKNRVIRMQLISVAASIIIIAGVFFWLDKKKKLVEHHDMAKVYIPKQPSPVIILPKTATSIDKKQSIKIENDYALKVPEVANPETDQSIFYYTKLIETKQHEITQIRNIDPELYVRSQKSILDMKQVYDQLFKQLPKSVNRKQLLQMMIENLQIQEQILSNQLQIIKELQTPNNSSDDKKSKAI